MAAAALAAQEAVAVGVDAHALAAGQPRAVGALDARLAPAGGLAGQGQLDRLLGGQRPGMVDVEVRQFASHQLGRGEPRGRILAGVAGDGHGLLDHVLDRRLGGIGGRGAALALADIDGHRDALVAGQLDGLDLALADVDAHALVDAGAHLAGIGAEPAGQRQGRLGTGFQQRLLGDGIESLCHRLDSSLDRPRGRYTTWSFGQPDASGWYTGPMLNAPLMTQDAA